MVVKGGNTELINDIETKNLVKQSKESSINDIEYQIEESDINNNKNIISGGNNSIKGENVHENNNINNNNEEKKPLLGSHKYRIFKPRTPTQKEIENMNFKKLENLFNQALNSGLNSNKDRNELEEFVMSNPNKKINTKDTYFNIIEQKKSN